ncbi:MAG: hypothetical protein MUO40_05195 [Anaerolineaceae bacterium]|nr:hypothetical protein [Anaerolineaceae bacterium]
MNIDKNGADEFCEYLDSIKEEGFLGEPVLAKYSEYNVQLAPKISIKVPWTIQINVLESKKILIMYKRKLIRNLWNGKPENCLVEEFFELINKIKEVVDGYKYQGDFPKPAILIPTMNLLAIPQLEGLIPDKGMDDVL